MTAEIEAWFAGLRESGYSITSPATDRYNCIAWAAGDVTRFWWPGAAPDAFWPNGVPEHETLAAFETAFASVGFVACDDGAPEPDVEKLALYTDAYGVPQHAARSLPNGRWTSKLGEMQDIEHALDGLEGTAYGRVARFMKRAR